MSIFPMFGLPNDVIRQGTLTENIEKDILKKIILRSIKYEFKV